MKIKGSKNNVIVEGNLIFDNAQQAKEALLSKLGKLTDDKEVTIDLSQVTEIDSSGIQLLIAFFKSLDKRKLRYKINGITDETVEILNLAGISKYFKIEV
jgi:anti-anti-sigma factor